MANESVASKKIEEEKTQLKAVKEHRKPCKGEGSMTVMMVDPRFLELLHGLKPTSSKDYCMVIPAEDNSREKEKKDKANNSVQK